MSNDADESGDETPEDDGTDHDSSEPDSTVPQVDLSLRDLSVSVTGRSDDDLETVEQSALALVEHLVEKAKELEEDHDEYGLS